MDRRLVAALVVLVTVLVPPILAINGIRVLANDWYVRFEYGRLPPDPYGFTRAERTELGLTGLRSILPRNEQGIELLRDARLADGSPAFREKEFRHMADVRRLMGIFYPAHLAVVVAIAALALGLRLAGREVAPVGRGLQYGAALTLVIGILTVVAVAVNAEGFLTGFHTIFFEEDSWRFADEDTLRRLYPDRFWSETAALLGLGTAAQAMALFVGARLRLRRRSP